MKYLKILYLACLISVTSCSDFLDKEPVSSISPQFYLNTENELASFASEKYSLFPVHAGYDLGNFAIDNNSDNQCSGTPNSNFIPNEVRVSATGGWVFTKIRDCNYFFEQVIPKYETGKILGNKSNIEHYIGEMYFFRAYIYFDYLKKYGDFPIVTKVLSDSYPELVEANKRRPRNEVARFILSDLDKAINLLSINAPQSNRITKYVANLFKSRVALYEGTWLKYHAGSARVPGSNEWPGKNIEYLKDFSVNLDNEINFFLSQAMDAAKEVADNIKLKEYEELFNSIDLTNYKEVLLWKKYDISQNIQHHVVAYLQQKPAGGNGSGNTGFSRALIESFLMNNGLPIYDKLSGYKGDKNLLDVVEGRDNRLIQSLSVTNDPINPNTYFTRPGITNIQSERAVTGYVCRKGLNQNLDMSGSYPSYTACVIFRAAEAYLNYIEADYVKNNTLDARSNGYWRDLRIRANVDPDFSKTISATNLELENDLSIYSGENQIDATLYNIRRERRCEFIAEGFRKDDLYRWRSLDKLNNYHLEGFNLWDENFKLYEDNGKNLLISPEENEAKANVSSKTIKYLRPNQILKNNKAYNGYSFMQGHYLSPISFEVFRLSTIEEGGDPSTSIVYQNPYWEITPGTTALK